MPCRLGILILNGHIKYYGLTEPMYASKNEDIQIYPISMMPVLTLMLLLLLWQGKTKSPSSNKESQLTDQERQKSILHKV